MGDFDFPRDEVFIYDGEKKSLALISGQPFESEVREWICLAKTEKQIEKITIVPAEGTEYTVYENGKFMNCRDDFM